MLVYSAFFWIPFPQGAKGRPRKEGSSRPAFRPSPRALDVPCVPLCLAGAVRRRASLFPSQVSGEDKAGRTWDFQRLQRTCFDPKSKRPGGGGPGAGSATGKQPETKSKIPQLRLTSVIQKWTPVTMA